MKGNQIMMGLLAFQWGDSRPWLDLMPILSRPITFWTKAIKTLNQRLPSVGADNTKVPDTVGGINNYAPLLKSVIIEAEQSL